MQTKLLVPFTPHICEEIWFKLGNESFISLEKWPEYDESKINPSLDVSEGMIANILEDTKSVLKLAKVEAPQKITFFVAEDWKYQFYKKFKEQMQSTRNAGDIIKTLMATELKKHGQEITKLVPKLIKGSSRIPRIITHQEAENQFLTDAIDFFKQEFNCEIEVINEQDSKEDKAKSAMPGKPATLIS